MPKSWPAIRWNESRISSSVTGSRSGACSRSRSHAIARNQPSPNGISSTTPFSLGTPVNVSPGARVSRTSANRMCVSYCLPTKSIPSRLRTVLCAPSHPTTYSARTLSPPAHSTVTPSPSCVRPTTSAPADDLDPEFVGAGLQHPFRPALRNDEHHPEPGGQLAQIQRRAARRGDLTHRHPARQQLPGQTSRIKQLQSPGMYRECPGDVGRVGSLFEQPRLGAAERQLAREHQPVGPAPTTTTSASVHDPDISRSVRFAVLVEPIGEFAAPTDRTKSSFGGLPGPRGGDDEHLVAGLDTGIGLRNERMPVSDDQGDDAGVWQAQFKNGDVMQARLRQYRHREQFGPQHVERRRLDLDFTGVVTSHQSQSGRDYEQAGRLDEREHHHENEHDAEQSVAAGNSGRRSDRWRARSEPRRADLPTTGRPDLATVRESR